MQVAGEVINVILQLYGIVDVFQKLFIQNDSLGFAPEALGGLGDAMRMVSSQSEVRDLVHHLVDFDL